MGNERARQKRFERKRRKREERRQALKAAPLEPGAIGSREVVAPPAILHREEGRVFATNPRAKPLPPGVESWPVVRAFAPVRNVWEATGLGTAGVIRQQPDGLYSSAFFVLKLLEHGLEMAFGGRDESLAKVEEDLAGLLRKFPPCEEGPVELAASFAWGARAFSEAEGYRFPDHEIDRFYGLMPRPPGTQRDWVARLVGRGGLTPEGLIRAIRENPQPDDLPDGKEILILTEMTFEVADAAAAVAALGRAEPEFIPEGEGEDEEGFTWTRPYPRNHWSPPKWMGGRQIVGGVRVTGSELAANAKTLSMAAKLVERLNELLGGGALRLKGSRWSGMREVLQGEAAVPGEEDVRIRLRSRGDRGR